jgi:hypothetical protein
MVTLLADSECKGFYLDGGIGFSCCLSTSGSRVKKAEWLLVPV